uniref:ATP synthase subunit a n=1 Tax=Thelepus plagiostoma TaxID=1084972 RepID=A0A8B6QMF5_9ANNE|nr:ATP synthase F0 subunit 6 [Thelepus plagiostoma]QTJ29898.1 ATP synthase F0 subunit 6 [Thelepus plagiostoma]
MLTDIFSSFDPATISLHNMLPSPLFWLVNLLIIAVISSSFWQSQFQLTSLLSMPKAFMASQTSRTKGSSMKAFHGIVSTLFMILITMNLSGLTPYIFSISSHLFFTLSIALPLWLALVMSSIYFSPSRFLGGLLPGGAPDWLNPFLVIVESLSILVRPITLSFRLAANMSAGHIVLALIGIYMSAALFNPSMTLLTLIAIQTFYILFEVAICLIQAYIFCLLITLYSDDHS